MRGVGGVPEAIHEGHSLGKVTDFRPTSATEFALSLDGLTLVNEAPKDLRGTDLPEDWTCAVLQALPDPPKKIKAGDFGEKKYFPDTSTSPNHLPLKFKFTDSGKLSDYQDLANVTPVEITQPLVDAIVLVEDIRGVPVAVQKITFSVQSKQVDKLNADGTPETEIDTEADGTTPKKNADGTYKMKLTGAKEHVPFFSVVFDFGPGKSIEFMSESSRLNQPNELRNSPVHFSDSDFALVA